MARRGSIDFIINTVAKSINQTIKENQRQALKEARENERQALKNAKENERLSSNYLKEYAQREAKEVKIANLMLKNFDKEKKSRRRKLYL